MFSELKKWIILQFAKHLLQQYAENLYFTSRSVEGRQNLTSWSSSQEFLIISMRLVPSTRKNTNENKTKKNRHSDSEGEEFLWRNSQLLTQKSFSADFTHQNHGVEDR